MTYGNIWSSGFSPKVEIFGHQVSVLLPCLSQIGLICDLNTGQVRNSDSNYIFLVSERCVFRRLCGRDFPRRKTLQKLRKLLPQFWDLDRIGNRRNYCRDFGPGKCAAESTRKRRHGFNKASFTSVFLFHFIVSLSLQNIGSQQAWAKPVFSGANIYRQSPIFSLVTKNTF